MNKAEARAIGTDCIHAGSYAAPDPYHAHSPPIYQTSTFDFESVEHGRRAFTGEDGGASHIYTRLGNPTVEALERTIARLEGRGVEDEVRCLAFGSGMAAISTVLTALAAGGRVVAQEALYGCTSEFLAGQAPELGIETTWIDASDTEAALAALQRAEGTRLLYLETPANPTLTLCDLRELSRAAHEAGALVCADNTFATPYHQRPLEHGVDVVLHSTTKYINGHGTVVGGAAVGRAGEVMDRVEAYRKNLGGVPSPFDCWLQLCGLKTLGVRMERHAANAQRVAVWLEGHSAVRVVHYPGLSSHPHHQLASRQMENGFGGIVSFELMGGYDAGARMMELVKLCTLAVSLGTVDTLIQHPASMTHSVMSAERRRRAGITDGLIRLSVGIEEVEDILADLERALHRV